MNLYALLFGLVHSLAAHWFVSFSIVVYSLACVLKVYSNGVVLSNVVLCLHCKVTFLAATKKKKEKIDTRTPIRLMNMIPPAMSNKQNLDWLYPEVSFNGDSLTKAN